MPQWTTRLLVWARDNLLHRARPRPISAAVGYERAGGTRWESPVPWTADAAVIDVLFHLPASARRKPDFSLRLPLATFPADSLRPDTDNHFRITFRFPVPPDSLHGDLLWKGHVLASVPIPVLTPSTFLAGLTVANAGTSVKFGTSSVATTSFVPDRCEAFVATASLKCQSPLSPLAEMGLKATFTDEANSRTHAVPLVLTTAQLASTEAVIAAMCPEVPRHAGSWLITWSAGEHTLLTQRVHAIPLERFETSVRVLETRFALIESGGAVRTMKLPPSLVGAERVGPCFVLSSSDAGAAGVCQFEMLGISGGDLHPLLWRSAETVITDSPTVFVPALFDPVELGRVSGFELRLRGRLLGIASLRPVPAATLNAEGGFTPPPEFAWSSAADDELTDRLKRLQG